MLDDVSIPSMNVHSSSYEPFPRMNGTKHVLYHSPDGRVLAASFTESGRHTMTMPFDEVAYVVSGSVSIRVRGGDEHFFGPGDVFFLRKGLTLEFDISDDFKDVAIMIADTPIPRP